MIVDRFPNNTNVCRVLKYRDVRNGKFRYIDFGNIICFTVHIIAQNPRSAVWAHLKDKKCPVPVYETQHLLDAHKTGVVLSNVPDDAPDIITMEYIKKICEI